MQHSLLTYKAAFKPCSSSPQLSVWPQSMPSGLQRAEAPGQGISSSQRQHRQLSHTHSTRGRTWIAPKRQGKPTVLLTNKVNPNDINSFRSEWMTSGTCHRRLHGEFTDGQAISIKLSFPPILLWITALKPLNYLNSISLRIFEASCSD